LPGSPADDATTSDKVTGSTPAEQGASESLPQDQSLSVAPADEVQPAADPCNVSVSAPGDAAVEVDLDGDGQDDRLWLDGDTAIAILADGRTIQTPLDSPFAGVSLAVWSGSDGPLILNLDDEPGEEVLVEGSPNNWRGVVPLDLDGCRLYLVPSASSEHNGTEGVVPLALSTGSPSCQGVCSFSFTCLPEVGLRHTEATLADGVQRNDETGAFADDASLVWRTTRWEMVDGHLVPSLEGEGTALVTEIGQLPELTSSVVCELP
jgi:hypothetical protein